MDDLQGESFLRRRLYLAGSEFVDDNFVDGAADQTSHVSEVRREANLRDKGQTLMVVSCAAIVACLSAYKIWT